MKPLNHKERDNKFLKFVISAILTLVLTIFCLYYTNYFLTDASTRNRVKQYSLFQNYRTSQQQYTKQLGLINKSFSENSGSLITGNMVNDFKTSFTKRRETSLLMTKLMALSRSNLDLVDEKNRTGIKLRNLNRDLIECNKRLNSLPTP